MQAIKKALGSHDHETTSHTHGSTSSPTTGTNRTGSIGQEAQQSLGTGDSEYNSSRTSGYSPTDASATRSTGNADYSTSDNTRTGAGRSSAGLAHLDHKEGHDHSIGSKFDPTASNVTHDHKHLNHVVHADHRTVEVEEVERQREIDRHVHHVQHHVQPVIDRQVRDEVLHTNSVPVTEIHEKHSSTDEDRGLFQGLASQHQNTETHRGKERTIVDLGEKVHENVHHHVHHVTQPVIEQEVVERHRIHTVIPVHHVTHEAPVVHKSSVHEPVSMDSFLQGGGKLGSGINADNAGVLNTGECVREVDGVGEKLAQELHLGGGSSHSHGSTSYGSSGTTTGGYESKDGDMHKSKMGAKVDDMTPDRRSSSNTTSGQQGHFGVQDNQPRV